ncbi:MAG: dienelactone hydrolase family protein, partial [Steroidobacteraceae bacterium]
MHRSRLAGFIIDCRTDDLEAAAEFWSRAVGMPLKRPHGVEEGHYRELDSGELGLHLEVQQVGHPSRVHLDIESDDIEAEVRRLEALGAKRVQKSPRWWVMEAYGPTLLRGASARSGVRAQRQRVALGACSQACYARSTPFEDAACMGEFTTIMARDGHEFRAWLAAPPGTARGAIVVMQEIFGVNRHIRTLTDSFAAEGYVAIAPSMFDRVRKGIELGYSPPESQEGIGYTMQLKPDQTLKDMSAAVNVVKHAGRVGVVGYCWGGTMAYIAACELPVACAVAYYGGSITKVLPKAPKKPVMYHFG